MNLFLILTAFMASLTGLLGDRAMASVPAKTVLADRIPSVAIRTAPAPRARPVATAHVLERTTAGDPIVLPAVRTIDWFGARRV